MRVDAPGCPQPPYLIAALSPTSTRVTRHRTVAHFVHCAKPNGMEQPELLSYEMVAEQLTSLGTLEVVQLMGLGFPVRIRYEDIRRRYLTRLGNLTGIGLLSPKLFTEMMLEVCEVPIGEPPRPPPPLPRPPPLLPLPPPPLPLPLPRRPYPLSIPLPLPQCHSCCLSRSGEYKLGVTRIFLKHRAAEMLEAIVPLDESQFEPLVRQRIEEFWAAAARIANAVVKYFRLKQWRNFFRCVLIAQKYLRMWLALRRFRRQVVAARMIQHAVRSHNVKIMYIYRKLQAKAVKLVQSYARRWIARTFLLKQRDSAVLIQRHFRNRMPRLGMWEKTALVISEVMAKWFGADSDLSGDGGRRSPLPASMLSQTDTRGGLLALLDMLRGPNRDRELPPGLEKLSVDDFAAEFERCRPRRLEHLTGPTVRPASPRLAPFPSTPRRELSTRQSGVADAPWPVRCAVAWWTSPWTSRRRMR